MNIVQWIKNKFKKIEPESVDIEKYVKSAVELTYTFLDKEKDKHLLAVISEFLPIVARQGKVAFKNLIFHLKKLDIENSIYIAMISATDEEKAEICKNASDGIYVAAVNQYEDRQRARRAMSLVLSLILSQLGGVL
jgi:L-ribulose-5-phosphate 3-epimerase UlaE